MSIAELRRLYHEQIVHRIIRYRSNRRIGDYPNFADSGNLGSVAIAKRIVRSLDIQVPPGSVAGQTLGGEFETITKDFLQSCFDLLTHLRPGDWYYSTQLPISQFDQYKHLASLKTIIEGNSDLAAALGEDYIIKPDIVISRSPISDDEINQHSVVVNSDPSVARLTPLRETNNTEQTWFLHASVSCKWTIRSDRSQNARAEALNLVRNRKGRLPHIVAVTAEPLPTRINSLALGTGDLDCVYHFALPELQDAVGTEGNQDQQEALNVLIEGSRLRDISDLPFDLLL